MSDETILYPIYFPVENVLAPMNIFLLHYDKYKHMLIYNIAVVLSFLLLHG